jgi:hypothetical protein
MAAPEYLHLEAKANNSLFGLAFQGGLGVFDKGKAEPGKKSDEFPEQQMAVTSNCR